jgi:hypothetical protein
MRFLLRARASLLGVVTLLAGGPLACGDDDPTGPRLATRYTLDRINGSALPVALSADPADNTVLAGSLHFRSDGRVARVLRVRTASGAEETYPDTLAYGQRGSRVWMLRPANPADSLWGTIGARAFEFQVGTTAPLRYQYVIAP